MTTMQSSGRKPSLPRLRRAEGELRTPFRLTQRDLEIVRAVYEYRALTAPQIEALFFPPTKERTSAATSTRCIHRLRQLFDYGFLARTEQPQMLSGGPKPLVYWLDQRGAQLLAQVDDREVEELDWDPKGQDVRWFFLEHLLTTNNVRIAIFLAARNHKFTIKEWIDDKALKSKQMRDIVVLPALQGKAVSQGKAPQKAAVVPDGYFVLVDGERQSHQFLEIDLRTVTGESSSWERRDWGRKVAAYLEYYRSGKYQERYETQSMRVLTVTTGEKRLANLKAITEKAGGKSRFWFTTFAQMTPEQVLTEPIWQVADREGLYSLTR
jgi:hypothetical protein